MMMQQARWVGSHPASQTAQESQKLPNTIGDDVDTKSAVSTEGEVDRVEVYANGRPTPYFSLPPPMTYAEARRRRDLFEECGSILIAHGIDPATGEALTTIQGDPPSEGGAPTQEGTVPDPGNCPRTARAGRSLLFNAERFYEEKESE